MIQTFQKDKGHGDEFVVKCQICGRVYAQIKVLPGSTMEYELTIPMVPCHANGMTVTTPEGDPFSVVLNLMDGKWLGEEFVFSVIGETGLIRGIQIMRPYR